MAVNFYDVNFNQPGDNNIPAISGYIINDYGYDHRSDLQGNIPMDYILSKPSATNNITGAISMDRKTITVGTTNVVGCRLQGGGYVYTTYQDAGPTSVVICDDNGETIEQLSLPYVANSSNLSFIGHFDSNDELDWASIGYTYKDSNSDEFRVYIDKVGWGAGVVAMLKPYVYLKYKYEYQVVIQKSLSGTNDFQISRFPQDWFTKKIYGTGEGQSQKYNEVVLRLDPDDLTTWDASATWKASTVMDDYIYNITTQNLSLSMAVYLEEKGYSLGSDIFRINSDGTFTNGADLSQANLIPQGTGTPAGTVEYEIEFSGGKLQIIGTGSFSHKLAILDNDDNILDEWQIRLQNNGTAIGEVNIHYNCACSCYLAENNNHYYLIGLTQYYAPMTDDDGNQISFFSGGYNYNRAGFFSILKVFNNDANQVLYRATEQEKIVPANPEDLTADETTNQTSDADHKNEYGEEIPMPKYNTGEWDDHTTEGIRGSGQGRTTGGNSERTLDQQPDLPGLPSIPTAVSTGFMKLYNPSDAEIQAFCTELTDDNILMDLKKYLGNNPLDFIVGLQVVPGAFSVGANKYKISYGSFHSDVSMYPITDEFTELDYGTLELGEIYASWEDYNPHTKMSIYLPYIGIRELDPDKINGTLLSLKYEIDAVTGSILAVLTSTRKDSGNAGAEYVVGQWAGQASYTIPLTNVQHNSAVNAVISVVGAGIGIGTAVATGGASALVTAGAVGSVGNALLSGAKSQKADVTMQGGVSGNLAFFTGKDAYIMIEYPIEGRPVDYDHIVGMPSNITTTLKQQPLDNYIEFLNIDISGIDAPRDEKQMIIDLLKGGVYT